MIFENGVKNIQAAAYNGARTVVEMKSALKLKDIYTNSKEFLPNCMMLLQITCLPKPLTDFGAWQIVIIE
jgi:hypothetical protein